MILNFMYIYNLYIYSIPAGSQQSGIISPPNRLDIINIVIAQISLYTQHWRTTHSPHSKPSKTQIANFYKVIFATMI
jgi:hypothetical protein